MYNIKFSNILRQTRPPNAFFPTPLSLLPSTVPNTVINAIERSPLYHQQYVKSSLVLKFYLFTNRCTSELS